MTESLALIDHALDTAADLVPGSPRAVLHDYVSSGAHADIYGAFVLQSKIDTERSLRAVADLVNGIITLFEAERGAAVSTMVLARSAGENIMRFCHVYDADEPPQRTLLRMVAVQLESVEDNLRTAEAFGPHGQDDARSARKNIAAMQEMVQDAGIVRLANQRRPEFTTNLTLDGVTENVRFNATESYRRYLQVGFWDWALGSGATHGRAWLLPNIVGTFDESPFMDRNDISITVTLQVLELATAFARSIGGHSGADTDLYQRKVHQRRLGVTAADRPPAEYAVSHSDYGRN